MYEDIKLQFSAQVKPYYLAFQQFITVNYFYKKSIEPCSGKGAFNSLPNDKILDWSKLKAFADDNKKVVK